MNFKTFCQSCSMPIDDAGLLGTNKDGTPSQEYCKYCYQQGEFIDPHMTLDEMKLLVKTKMEERHIPQHIIDLAVGSMPMLKRWKENVFIM